MGNVDVFVCIDVSTGVVSMFSREVVTQTVITRLEVCRIIPFSFSF